MWHRRGIRSLCPYTGSWSLKRRLKQMGQNPIGTKTCLALQPGLEERAKTLQHITLPHRGTAVHGMCQPQADEHRAASQGHAAPMGAGSVLAHVAEVDEVVVPVGLCTGPL